MSKCKNFYRDEYEKEFNSVKRSLKGQCFVLCSFCKCDINLESIGKAAIFAHNETQQHKDSARQTKSNQSIKKFSRVNPHQLIWTTKQLLPKVSGLSTL